MFLWLEKLDKVIEQKRAYMLVDGTMFKLTERYIPSLDRLRELIDRFYGVTGWLTNSYNTHIS